MSIRDIDSLATSLSQSCFQSFPSLVAMWPCDNLLTVHKRGQIRHTHGEMNIDFSLWSDDNYCVCVPRLKKASNRVHSKITTAKTGE